MNFSELVAKRYSVRQFSDKPIEKQKLEQILTAAQLAPTAKNIQPQHIYVVQSAESLEKLNKCTPCIYGAPVALVVCYDKDTAWKRPQDDKLHGDIDASIVCTHMMYQAQELGLSSVWVCYFDPAAVVKEFNLPENIIPSSILPIGYAANDAVPGPLHELRNPLSETVTFI